MTYRLPDGSGALVGELRDRPNPAVDPLGGSTVHQLRHAIRAALDELGVPGEGYPAPVANAVAILTDALAFYPEADE